MSSGIAIAPGPLPTTTSTRKSSIAMYSISSAGRAIRWISSRNSTSPSASEERIAARSPACWMAGPLVIRIGAPSSTAMIIARVVLPSPGGPDSSTWSGGRPRLSAACRISASCSLTRSWPISSASRRGRRVASTSRSSPPASAATRRSVVSSGSLTRLAPAERAQRGAQQDRDVRGLAALGGGVDLGGDRDQGLVRLARGPAKPDQRAVDLLAPAALERQRQRRAGRTTTVGSARLLDWVEPMPWLRDAEPVLELEHDPLGSLLADAGHQAQRAEILGGHRSPQRVRAVHGEHRLGQPWSDPARGLQQLKDRALVVVREPVEGQRVFPDHQRGSQPRRFTDAKRGQRAGRALNFKSDAADLDHGPVRTECGDRAADECDHALRPVCACACVTALASRACAPPRQIWQIASASASAASAGYGGRSSRSSLVTIACTCSFAARPLPVTAAFTSLGVCSETGSPRLAVTAIAIAAACAVPITVRTLCWLNTRSTATASGRTRSSHPSS